jgi:hypothetical protein
MSVFIFDSHGDQELRTGQVIERNGAVVRVFIEKQEPRGEPAAVVHLADDTMVTLIRPSAALEHDPQAWPRHAGRAPGVYVRTMGVTRIFSAADCRGVRYRLTDASAYVEVFTADRMFISNHLDLDLEQLPGELLLAVARFAPGVVIGDGSKGALSVLAAEAAEQRP